VLHERLSRCRPTSGIRTLSWIIVCDGVQVPGRRVSSNE
jgi:hypothetical protein